MTEVLSQVFGQFTGALGADQIVDAKLWRKPDHRNTRVHRFVVLPSSQNPRWLLPFEYCRESVQALNMYTPYALRARILKFIVSRMIGTGWKGWSRERIFVGSHEPLELESLVTAVTGESRPVFALSVGSAGRYRKLTVHVMRPGGEILGHIKLPLTSAAADRVRHEAEVLECLWRYPSLRAHVPKVLHAGPWRDGYILFQSSGPSAPGHALFGQLHECFLTTLKSVHIVHNSGRATVDRVADRWQSILPSLDHEWRKLGEAVLGRARADLDGVSVRCGIMHGDFAPWNTRVAPSGLYVFDWESADWDAPAEWDHHHFSTQVAALLNKTTAVNSFVAENGRLDARFLLYLLNSASHLFDEGVAPAHPALRLRRTLMLRHLATSI